MALATAYVFVATDTTSHQYTVQISAAATICDNKKNITTEWINEILCNSCDEITGQADCYR